MGTGPVGPARGGQSAYGGQGAVATLRQAQGKPFDWFDGLTAGKLMAGGGMPHYM
jgi:hypothetical protein